MAIRPYIRCCYRLGFKSLQSVFFIIKGVIVCALTSRHRAMVQSMPVSVMHVIHFRAAKNPGKSNLSFDSCGGLRPHLA